MRLKNCAKNPPKILKVEKFFNVLSSFNELTALIILSVALRKDLDPIIDWCWNPCKIPAVFLIRGRHIPSQGFYLGNVIFNDLIWLGYVVASGKKLRFLCRMHKYFSAPNLTTLQKAQIGIGAGSTWTIWLQKKTISLVDDPNITRHWTPLSNRRNGAELFYLFCQYCHGFCSSELSSIIPQPVKPAVKLWLLIIYPIFITRGSRGHFHWNVQYPNIQV